MITQQLERLGLFMGKTKDRSGNYEAAFFLSLNEWLLRQSGASWDNPEPIQRLLTNAEVRAVVIDYLDFMLKSPYLISYLGISGALNHLSPANIDIPWGWKDPRNTFTLPIWLDLFPNAKIIHILRHGIDVAGSLKARAEREQPFELLKARHRRRKQFYLYWFHRKRGGFAGNLRCASLEGSFSLWEAYVKEARKHVRTLADRAVEIKYEDYLMEPYESLKSLAKFCGISSTDSAISDAVKGVRAERAYAYRVNPILQAFATRVERRLAAQGY